MPKLAHSFDRYRIEYATTNPAGKDLVRIELFAGDKKVGQILSGEAIVPGSFAALHEQQIHLYFPSSMLPNALAILQGEAGLALFLELEARPDGVDEVRAGGITHA
jgi:hypothetical protein